MEEVRELCVATLCVVSLALSIWACNVEEDDSLDPSPGDANGDALALAVEGKVFGAVAMPEERLESSTGEWPTPAPPGPTPTPAPVPEQVTLAILTNCQPGEACLTYGVYEPGTERKEFVTATCAIYNEEGGFTGTCYTFTDYVWYQFCKVDIYVGQSDVTLRVKIGDQGWKDFVEASYAVSGDSDCVEFDNEPSPPPFHEE